MKASSKKLIIGTSIVFLALLGIWIIPANFEIVPNYSESLPYKRVLVKKGRMPAKKDQAFVFYVRNNSQLGVEKIKFIKLVGGLPGDKIEVKGGDVYFDNKKSVIKENDVLTQEDIFHAAQFTKLVDPEEFKKRKITVVDKEVFVDGHLIGVAKAYSKKQQKLHAITSDIVIPEHKVFAYTPHKDSFDSRYQEIGLIDEKDIVGTVIFTF
jgi:type IV secretory pathway protease TraF